MFVMTSQGAGFAGASASVLTRPQFSGWMRKLVASRADTLEDAKEFVPRKAAAEMLGVTISGVRRYERQHKLNKVIEDNGEVVYRISEIDAILDGRLERSEEHTSELQS